MLTTYRLQVEYKGQVSVLGTTADIKAWIEERKKRFPTAARGEQKREEATKRQAEARQRVLESMAKKQLEQEEKAKEPAKKPENDAEPDTDSDSNSDISSESSSTDDSSDDDAPEESTSKATSKAPPLTSVAATSHNTVPDLPKSRQVCQYFARSGRCRNGDACRFRHEKPEKKEVEGRKTLHQRMVEAEMEGENRVALAAVKSLGEAQFFEEG